MRRCGRRGGGCDDFDLAYAHEARARALACLGRLDEAATELAAARAVPIADEEDAKILAATSPPNPGTASPSHPHSLISTSKIERSCTISCP